MDGHIMIPPGDESTARENTKYTCAMLALLHIEAGTTTPRPRGIVKTRTPDNTYTSVKNESVATSLG